jgi:AraC-like DNA-binding protein
MARLAPSRAGPTAPSTPRWRCFRRVAAELGQAQAPLFPQTLLDDPSLSRLLAAAHAESTSADATRAEASLLAALRRLILWHGDADRPAEPLDRSSSQRRFARYEEVIEAGLAEELDLQALAAAAGVTRFQVIRDFKKLTGSTPAIFIRDRRLRRANRLIHEGASLADAAFAAGFLRPEPSLAQLPCRARHHTRHVPQGGLTRDLSELVGEAGAHRMGGRLVLDRATEIGAGPDMVEAAIVGVAIVDAEDDVVGHGVVDTAADRPAGLRGADRFRSGRRAG